jgi:hypothetical protein
VLKANPLLALADNTPLFANLVAMLLAAELAAPRYVRQTLQRRAPGVVHDVYGGSVRACNRPRDRICSLFHFFYPCVLAFPAAAQFGFPILSVLVR